MTDATITINPDGTGSVLLEGATTAVEGSTAADARRRAIHHVTQHAVSLGRPISVTAHESGRVYPVLVNTDGTVSQLTRNDSAAPTPTAPVIERAATPLENPAPTPAAQSTPASQASPAPALDAPGPDATTDLDATRPRHIVTDEQSAELPPAPAEAEDVASSLSAAGLPESLQTDAATEIPLAADPYESDPRWTDIASKPAEQGVRGTLNGMGLKLAPTEDELEQRRETLRQEIAREAQERVADEQRERTWAIQESRREARAREAATKDRAERTTIQTNLEQPKCVLIVNYKGGQGKTTATYGIAATAGRIRGGDVIAWDANETRGNLGFRSRKTSTERSVVDLLEEAAEDFTTVEGSKRSTLARYTRPQGDNHFAVLASDESSDKQDLVDGDAFETVREILGRFYSLILIDTGNNHRVSHFTAALEAADQLLVPVGAGADGAHAAEAMLDRFEHLGYSELVRNAVVLLTDSGTRRGDSTGIAAKFEQRVRAIIPIPFDPALDSGDEIDFEALQPATRAAYQEATAAIARGLSATAEVAR